MSADDYLLALKLHKQLNEEAGPAATRSPAQSPSIKTSSTSIVDPEWESMDPNPDIHSLFGVFNIKFFWKALGSVEVKWSPRMYTCAGICTYKGRGGCIVSLSLPLLQFRPRKDLVETLLHEMIHAYLFITKNNKDRGSHGPEFCKHMDRINRQAGTNITIYHSFHDEVNHFKTHVWRCNGSCQANPPYFGYVRRAVNRAPSPNDFWFSGHQRTCGGSFGKISEPDNFKARPRKKLKTDQPVGATDSSAKKKIPSVLEKNKKDLRNFFTPTSNNIASKNTTVSGSSSKGGASMLNQTSTSTNNGLSVPIRGIQPNKEQGDTIIKHGGIKNNIFGFGNLGKSASVEAIEPKTNNNNNVKDVVPFAGKGYVLGSSGANDKSKSRLLGKFNAPKKDVKQDDKLSPATSTSSNSSAAFLGDLTRIVSESDDDDDHSNSDIYCPVCNVLIKRGVSINEHLDECEQLENVFNSSRNHTLSDSDSDNEDYPRPEPATSPSSPSVNCPICTGRFTTSTINEHLDECLSFD